MFFRKPLRERFATDGEVVVGGEVLTTPYHVDDGTLIFIGGTADADAAKRLLAAEDDLSPIIDTNGRALAGVWIGDFERANLGPHKELQISLFATSTSESRPVPSHPFSIFKTLLTLPEAVMVCHGLWNTTERVVAYNRNVLSLDAHWSEGALSELDGATHFAFTQSDGGTIARGHLGIRPQNPADSREMMRHIGFLSLLKAALAPATSLRVANTCNEASNHRLVSSTYSRYRSHVTRRFDAADSLTIQNETYRSLGFEPACVQHLRGYELVFMRPVLRGNQDVAKPQMV